MALIDTSNLISQAFQPKQKHRFLLSLDGIPSFLVRSIDKPKASNKEIEVPILNRVKYFKGRTTYSPVNIVVIDAIEPNMTNTLWEWQLRHSNPKLGVDGSKSFYEVGQIGVTQIGPAGQIINKWVYHNCFLTEIDFGGNDASADQISQINFTIRYEYPTLQI